MPDPKYDIDLSSISGHYPPELDDRLFSKLETSYNAFDASTGLYEASLICRGCATDLQRRHLSAEGEAWIWAYNYLQEIQSDDPSFGLGLHSHYGELQDPLTKAASSFESWSH